MQAVINLSREGTKLRPLSCIRPAGGLTLGGKTLIKRLIEKLKDHKITDIVIVTGYMGHILKTLLGDGSDMGVKIKYIQSQFSDGALKEHADLLETEFIYFSEVVYTDIDFSKCIKFHTAKGAYATIIARKGAVKRILHSKDGRITRIEEQRLWNSISGDEKSLGIYVLNRDIVRFFAEEMSTDIFEGVMPQLVRAGKSIFCMETDALCEGIDTIAAYMRAGFEYLNFVKKKHPKGILIKEGAIVEKGALLEGPCYIGKNAHIHKGAKIGAYSHIGEGTIVCEGATFKRVFTGDGCRVCKNASLRGCILDDSVTIGENCAIHEQAVIGMGTSIGDASTVKSFVKIWPEKNIDSAVTVSENILWGQKKRTRLYRKGIIKGVVNADITPKFCTKLGECVGAMFEGGEVGISTDGSSGGIMVRDAVTAGLLGMGCRVKDFGEQPIPITRRGVMFYMLKGAVNISINEDEGESVAEITVIGKNGMDLTIVERKKLSDLFEKGDYIYPEGKKITECEYVFEYKIYYLKSLVDSTIHHKTPKKVLLACPALWGRRLIASAMTDMKCSVSMYMPYSADTPEKLKGLSQSVDTGGFDIGFATDLKGEKLTVILPGGRILDRDTYEALTALMIMKKYKNAKVYVPLGASSVIDTLAEKYGCQLIRTPVMPETMINNEPKQNPDINDGYIFAFDAVGAVIKIMEYLSCESIDALLEEIPPILMAKTVVEIPLEEIEQAMSRIKEVAKNTDEWSDGVRITLDKGWVAIIPDANKEVCNVVGEGASYEIAKELCDICVEKLLL